MFPLHRYRPGVFRISPSRWVSISYTTVPMLTSQDPRCSYILYSKMPGSDAFHLDNCTAPKDTEEVEHLVRSYAEHVIKLSQAPFNAIGSPMLSHEDTDRRLVGAAYMPTDDFVNPEPPHFGGPFHTMRDFYLWRIETIVDLIKKGFVYRDAPLFFYLLHLELRRMVLNEASFAKQDDEYYISHPDPAGRNMLVDRGAITAFVDWSE